MLTTIYTSGSQLIVIYAGNLSKKNVLALFKFTTHVQYLKSGEILHHR